MTDIFVEGICDPFPQGRETQCYRLHRVCCWEGLASQDTRDSVYRFTAPDAESVRRVLRASGFGYRRVWPGIVYRGSETVVPDQVLVLTRPAGSRSAGVSPPCTLELQALHPVGDLAMAYVSVDGTRLVACVWSAGRRFTAQLPKGPGDWSIAESWMIRD